jgi:uncharacterized protein (DUF433 family)
MNTPVLHIQVDDDGVPRTINQRVKVKMIAERHIFGAESVASIAEHYGITLADIYAALAYYHDNREYFEQRDRELQPLIEEGERYSAELKAKILKRMERLKHDKDE